MEQGNLWSQAVQAHTQWKNNLFLKKIVTLRHSTRTKSSTMQSTRRTLTSMFQAYRILQWNNYTAPAFETWFRKSRTTRIGTLFSETWDKVIHVIPSVQNQNKWYMKLGTSNCVNYSIWNPKPSAKDVYHIGALASYIARAGSSCATERRRTEKLSSTPWISSQFRSTIKRQGDTTGTVMGRSQGITSTSSRSRSRRNSSSSSWVSTTGSSATRNSARICLTSVSRIMSWNGQIVERRPHAPHHCRRNKCVPQQLVAPFEFRWFRYDAS